MPRLKAGFVQLPNFILTDKKLSAYAKLSYALLLSYAWQKDSCFPGQERMAERSGVSDRYLRQALKELQEQQLHIVLSVVALIRPMFIRY